MSEELRTVPQTQVMTPMVMLSMAVEQGADLDKLQKLMDLQERWEANEALKAYNQAFASFKAEAVQIIKKISVTDGPLKGKKYADLFAAVDSATPALSKHGLSASWKITKDDKDWIEVTCILKHELGHTECVSMGGPPDSGGAKNAIQARASSVSYLERYTFLAITGLAATEQDNDGNGFGVDESEFQNYLKAIKEASTIEDLQKVWNKAMASSKNDTATQSIYIKTKDARKVALRSGN